MQRVQKLLSVGALLVLGACQKAEPVISVTDFLNDPALATATRHSCAVRNDRETNQTCLNMGQAYVMAVGGAYSHCYKGDVADKACVAAVLANRP